MRLNEHLTYANVTSTLALVAVLSGGGAAVAAGLAANSVGSRELKSSAVKTVDLAKNAVNSSKVKNGALTGADVKDDALTGADIDEDTLGLVGPIVASAVGLANGDLTAARLTLATVSLTAPAAGFVLVTGESTFEGDDATSYLTAFLEMDGIAQRSTYWELGDVDSFWDESNMMTVVVPVTAGEHSFALSVAEDPSSSNSGTYYRPQVTAQYFPEGTAAVQPDPEPDF